MRWLLRVAAVGVLLAGSAFAQRFAQPQALAFCEAGDQTVAYTGARWFTGNGFQSSDVFVTHEQISFHRPAQVNRVIDIHNMYVVPPYGEAHNHNIDYTTPEATAAIFAKYAREGVFYVLNPGSAPRGPQKLVEQGRVNTRGNLDAIFSYGLLTASGGHPSGLYKRNFERGIMTKEDGDGGFMWIIDDRHDLDEKWPRILAGKSDFIKTILVYSEEYAKRKNDEKYFNWRALDPALLPEITRRAHQAGLRMMTHIESAADFRAAQSAKVDMIAHMPGFRGDESAELPDAARYELSEADAKLAARQGTIIVTTMSGIAQAYPLDGEKKELRMKFDTLFRRNLALLKKHDARVVIGSDEYRHTSREEALYIASLGVFTPLEMLHKWSEETPRAIFPGRKIGRLQEGYEASFLVLEKDPSTDFQNTTQINMRVKQGCILPQ